MTKEGAGPYDDLLAEEIEKEVAKRKIEIPEGSGSGKNGRVLKADMIAALEADDGERAVQGDSFTEIVEDDAGDAPEPMDEVEEELAAEEAKPNGVIKPTAHERWSHRPGSRPPSTAEVKVGDVVLYRDKFNGSTQDARISGIVDAEAGIVDLAVFAGSGGASRREAVPRGPRSGHWMPKGAA